MLMRSIAAALLCSAATSASARAQKSSADVMRRNAAQVVALDTRRQLVGATPAVIDSLLALYSDSVTYEDPNVGVVLHGQQAMRTGIINYLGSTRAVHVDAPHVTVGSGVVIWDATTPMEIRDGTRWSPVKRHGVRVIEFDAAGKVRRLIDYPR
jgi:hypothetical protein